MFNVWENVLAEIKKQISSSQYTICFLDSTIESSEGGKIVIAVRNLFAETNIKKFEENIESALKKNGVDVKSIEFTSHRARVKTWKPREVSIEDIQGKTAQDVRGGSRASNVVPTLTTNLNPKFTMESFVKTSNTDLAVSVAQYIIEHPGDKYNPFFLYGGSGLGKTHLVQAIGNALYKKNPKLKILYIPINHFYSEFVDATQHGKMDAFQKKYKQLDVFIVDDFQFIIGKEKSQIEFFDIFNDMQMANKQIIVTSDRLPSEIETVDVRLSSRLTQCGAWDIQMPSFEDRCAILRAKAEFDGVDIDDVVIEKIAENIKTNVRDLQSYYSKLITIADVRGVSPLELINDGSVPTASAGFHSKSTTPKKIVEKVAKFYNLSVAEVCGRSRVAVIKNARQVAMYLLKDELKLSTTQIAREVGVKDHTTVMHGIKKIKSDSTLDFELREQINSIRTSIYG